MLLSGQVPLTLAREIPGCLPAIVGGRRREDISLWALYPGGRSILDALSEALGLNEDALRHLREVLRCFGNMSSATIMFVLKSMLRTKSASGLGCAMAFGPGLAAESMIFELGTVSEML
jgi:alpha-pyrone synthase